MLWAMLLLSAIPRNPVRAHVRRVSIRLVPALPEPDPNESPFAEPDGLPFEAPMTVFSRGIASPSAQRLADAIVRARPGLLFVVVR